MAYIFQKLQESTMLTQAKIDGLEEANELKSKGNEFFQQKDYKGAISYYHQALLKLRSVDPPFGQKGLDENHDSMDESSESAVFYKNCNKLKMTVHLNLAACLIEIPNKKPEYYAKAAQYCDTVLQKEPTNLKALYRKSVALYLSKNYHSALSLLRIVDKRLNGRDEKIREYLAACESKVRESEQQLKERMSRAFSDDQQHSSAAASTSSAMDE